MAEMLDAADTEESRRLRESLMPGERILWSARPAPGRMWPLFGIWLFAIPWTAFALFWELMALSGWLSGEAPRNLMDWGFGIVFPLFGLPFVAIGFVMLAIPLWGMRKAARTRHAVTNRRMITVSTGRRTEMLSVFLDRIGPIERSEGRDGWGSIKVQTRSRIDGDGDRITERFEMTGIPDVARVERLILSAQRADAA